MNINITIEKAPLACIQLLELSTGTALNSANTKPTMIETTIDHAIDWRTPSIVIVRVLDNAKTIINIKVNPEPKRNPSDILLLNGGI